MKRAWLLALACALPAACGSDERFEGPRSDLPDAGVTPTALPPPDAAPAPPKPKRTVTTKNPFGNVAAKNNLLWDGDFEWTSTFAQQAGWVNATLLVSYSAFSQVRPDAACRSGIKCGYLAPNQRVAAIGVSPGAKKKVQASIWVKVPGTQCSDVSATLMACDYLTDPDVELSDADGLPDSSGWCQLVAVGEPRQRATCLQVESRFEDGEALIDDAVVAEAADSAVPSGASPTAAERAALDQVRARLRERLRPTPTQPGEAELALAAWGRRAR